MKHIRVFDKKMNNAGYSLVELIVAIAVGSIIAGSIGALISFAVARFRNDTAETAMQYEIQTSLNDVMDSIMSSSGMVIGQNASGTVPYTDYAAFGNFKTKANGKVDFDGIVLVSGTVTNGKFNIYMNKVNVSDQGSSLAAVQAAVTNVKNNFTTNPNPYLLGENAKEFRIEPVKDSSGKYIGLDTTTHVYDVPINLEVEIDFEKDGSGRVIHKHVKDQVYMRNRARVNEQSSVYVGVTGAEVEYKPKKRN